ncbi:MAG: arsenate reductase ArsC [Elusimicrobia bacterium]|nr:arsenate reductase ArsC [Elusimicrobiota bacterium]
MIEKKIKVLFLCTSNSCRSQMAEGILKALASDRFEVFSAGAKASFVHPFAVKVLAETSVDISAQKSKSVLEFKGAEFDYVITLCGDSAKEYCPSFIGKAQNRLHWNFDDPALAQGTDDEILNIFRKVRDQIKIEIEKFVKSIE